MARDDRRHAHAVAALGLGASSVGFLAAGAYLLLVREQTLFGGVLLAVAVGDALLAAYFARRGG